MAFCFQELIDNQQQYPAGIELHDERIPKIPIPGEVTRTS
jgi:hypothetical protein